MQVLHLDSSALGAASVSRQLSAAVVERLRALHPDLRVTHRDLAADPALHFKGAHMAARAPGATVDDLTLTADLEKGNAYLDELFAADVVVVGAPMYNFSIPSPLKAWIDRIAVAGRTFRYTADGPEGLLGGRRVVIASARGGIYSSGPAAAVEHQESYLRAVFGFLGITEISVVRAEGIALGPEAKDAALAQAHEAIAAIAA